MDFLEGHWKGEVKTWFDPKGEPQLGTFETRFQKILGGLFIEETYTGTIGDKAHEGRRTFGIDKRQNLVTCFWVDTFHTGATAMNCQGAVHPQRVTVEGHYFGGDEKWGWRMEFSRPSPDQLVMKHTNISPRGEEDRAIEAILKRV